MGGNNPSQEAETALTVQERVLLHIYRFRPFFDGFEVPSALCQAGIAKGVGVRRSHVSIVLKGLRDKGLAQERMAHVRGGKRRKKVYELNEKGKAEAAKIASGLEKDGIPIDKVLAIPKEKEEGRQHSWAIPEIKYFFGRDEELERFCEFIGSKPTRAFAVSGLPGIGKTTFLAQAIKQCCDGNPRAVFWYTFKEWSSLQALLSNLSTYLSEMGIGGLNKVMGRYGSGPVDLDAAAGAVLEAGTLLLVLDDVHLIDEKTTHFLKALVQSEAKSTLKIAIAGRVLPRFFTVRDSKVKGNVQELTLEGLGPAESERLYKAVVDRDDFKKVYPISKGHPLSIELIGLAGGSTMDSQRFIFEEIYNILSEEERATLRAASVYREPVSAEGFFIEHGVSFKAIDDLALRGLLRPFESDLRAHELIRDFFYEHLSPSDRRTLHAAAAQFYLEQGGDDPWLESHYHLIRAGLGKRSAELLMTRASELIRKGHHEEVLKIATELEGSAGGDIGKKSVDVLKVMAEIQNLHGDRERARSTCHRMMEAAKDASDRRSLVQGQILLGAIDYELERWDEAVRWYKAALLLSEELTDQ